MSATGTYFPHRVHVSRDSAAGLKKFTRIAIRKTKKITEEAFAWQRGAEGNTED